MKRHKWPNTQIKHLTRQLTLRAWSVHTHTPEVGWAPKRQSHAVIAMYIIHTNCSNTTNFRSVEYYAAKK